MVHNAKSGDRLFLVSLDACCQCSMQYSATLHDRSGADVSGVTCRTGLFDNVDVKVTPTKKGKSQVRFIFKEKVWPELQSFQVAPSGTPQPYSTLKLTPRHSPYAPLQFWHHCNCMLMLAFTDPACLHQHTAAAPSGGHPKRRSPPPPPLPSSLLHWH